MFAEKACCPSPLQRRVLIVLAGLDAKRPGPVASTGAVPLSDATRNGAEMWVISADLGLLHVSKSTCRLHVL